MAEVSELSPLAPRDRLIVALDAPDVGWASGLVERIGDGATFYKIGMELAYGGRPCARAGAGFGGKAGLSRPQAARHSQYRRAGDGAGGETRREVPHRSRLSANDARRGRRRQGLGNAHSRRHCADLLRRRRSLRRVLPVRGGRDGPAPRRAGARARRRRTGGERRRGGDGAPDRWSRHAPRHSRHPAGGRGGRRPEASRDAGRGDPQRRRLPRRRPPGDPGARSAARLPRRWSPKSQAPSLDRRAQPR